jgi:hypothetical protein
MDNVTNDVALRAETDVFEGKNAGLLALFQSAVKQGSSGEADASTLPQSDNPPRFGERIAGYIPLLPKPPAPPSQPTPSVPEFGSTDNVNTVLDGSQYSSAPNLQIWSGLTTGEDSATALQTEQELNRPLAAAEALSANWTKWGLDKGIDFANPPTSLPPEAQDIIKYVAQNPAFETALDVAGAKGGKADGLIQHHDVDQFIAAAKSSAQDASNQYASYVKNNPNAGDLSKNLVRTAAIISANQRLVQNADPSHYAGATNQQGDNGLATSAGLAALVSSNPGLAAPLTNAAKLWSQPGMFNQLDRAGDDPAIFDSDGTFNSKNISDWISKVAPKNDQEFTAILSDAANRNMVAGVDTSQLGPDVFINPGNYTGQQKAAVLQQLTDLNDKITRGNKENYWDEPVMQNAGINPNVNKVQTDLDQKIAQLSADPEVQNFISGNRAQALQTIVGSDPTLHATMQEFYDGELQNGQALNAALSAKGGDGKQLTTEQGLEAFVGEVGIYSQALGTGGQAMTGLNLQQIVQNSGQEATLQQAYQNDILSGKELSSAIASGTDIATAVKQFTADAAAFGSALPSDYVAAHAAQLEQTFSDTLSDSIFGSTTQSELNAAFADGSGNLDIAKLNDVLSLAASQNPDLFKDSNGNVIPLDKVLTAFGSVFTQVRQGAKLQDAIAKLGGPSANASLGAVYGAGILHLVSALFTGGALAAKAVANGSSPTVVGAGLISSSFQLMGGLMEAGAKYGTSAPGSVHKILDPASLKQIESAGKAIGGAGNIIAGALGIFNGVQDLKNGQQVVGGISISSGITSIWSGVLGSLEGGVGLADAFGVGLGVDAAALAATSATLGIIGAGVATLGILGLVIFTLVEDSKHTFTFTDQTSAELKQWGITGGPVEPGDTTPLPMVPPGTGQ